MGDAASFVPAAADVGAAASDIGSNLVSVGGDLGVTGLPSIIGDAGTGLVSDVGSAAGGAAGFAGSAGPILTGVSDLAGGTTSALPAFVGAADSLAGATAGFGAPGNFGGGPITIASANAPISLSPASITPGVAGGTAAGTAGASAGVTAAPASVSGIDPSQIAHATALPMDSGGGAGIIQNNSGLAGAFNSVSGFVKNNPWVTQLGIPAAGLAYLAASQKPLSSIPGYNSITKSADQLSAQGAQLAGYLQSGTLPPGVQTSLHQAAEAAKATIRSQYAASGQSGSSAEAADLSNVDNTIAGQGANIALQLLNTGVNESGLSAQLYGQIMQTALSQDKQLTQGIASLAGAASRPTINITSP